MLVSDNGPQFARNKLHWFCQELKIEHQHASVKHAQTNGQIQAANKSILNGLKKRLDALEGKWTEELQNILWVVRTTP